MIAIKINQNLSGSYKNGTILKVGEDVNEQQAELFISIGRAVEVDEDGNEVETQKADQGVQADQGEPTKQGRAKQK